MRRIYMFFNILLLSLLVAFAANMYITANEIEAEVLAERKLNDRRIEELSKEIRLLKTDIDITKNGYKEE